MFSTLGIEKNTAIQLSKILMTSTQNIENILPKTNTTVQERQMAIDQFYANIATHLSHLKLYPDFLPTIEQLKSQ